MHDHFSIYEEKASTIQVYPCPSCRETISAGTDRCRFCNAPVDASIAKRLLAENRRVTSAVARANTYSLSVWLAMVQTLVGLLGVFSNDVPKSFLYLPVIPLVYGIQWLYRYRSLTTQDADYPVSVRKVKRTIVVWFLAMLVPWAIYALGS